MRHSKSRPGTLTVSLITLVFGLSATQLRPSLLAQTPDSGSAPAATPVPTQPYVLPPTNERPTSPATADTTPEKRAPHAIQLPPPPDDSANAAQPAKSSAAKTQSTPGNATAGRLQQQPAADTSGSAAAAPAAQAPGGLAAGSAVEQGAATFGFYAGETREQIIAAVGKDNILKQQGDILEVAAAPKPDPEFDSFLLIVGNDSGLVKLIATGKDIEDDPAGHLMKTQFATIRTDLSKGYGDPSDNFDFLDAKATHRAPNQFMLSLTNTERTLAAYWTKKDFGNQISSISLSGNGLGDDTGYLSVEYEFTGYHAYLLAKK